MSATEWFTAEDYAADLGITPSEVISMILDGALTGERCGDRWYVIQPVVVVLELGRDGEVLLRISACRIGSYVMAGREQLCIPLRSADLGRVAALVAIEDAMRSAPELPIAILLNGEEFLVDASLWLEMSAALAEFETMT